MHCVVDGRGLVRSALHDGLCDSGGRVFFVPDSPDANGSTSALDRSFASRVVGTKTSACVTAAEAIDSPSAATSPMVSDDDAAAATCSPSAAIACSPSPEVAVEVTSVNVTSVSSKLIFNSCELPSRPRSWTRPSLMAATVASISFPSESVPRMVKLSPSASSSTSEF